MNEKLGHTTFFKCIYDNYFFILIINYSLFIYYLLYLIISFNNISFLMYLWQLLGHNLTQVFTISFLFSDDFPLPVAVSLHPPVPAFSSRCSERTSAIYRGCGLPLLWPLWPSTRCCLCGSGHQHYLPVCSSFYSLKTPFHCVHGAFRTCISS